MKKQKGFVSIIIILVVSLLFVGIYFSKASRIEKTTNDFAISNNVSDIKITINNDNTSTYSNPKYGWEITVPSNWSIKKEDVMISNPENINEQDKSYYFFSSDINSIYQVQIDSYSNNLDKAFPQIVDGHNNIDNANKTKIAGLPTQRTFSVNADDFDNILYYFTYKERYYTVTITVPNNIRLKNLGEDNIAITKNFDKIMKDYENILSTFKFVD